MNCPPLKGFLRSSSMIRYQDPTGNAAFSLEAFQPSLQRVSLSEVHLQRLPHPKVFPDHSYSMYPLPLWNILGSLYLLNATECDLLCSVLTNSGLNPPEAVGYLRTGTRFNHFGITRIASIMHRTQWLKLFCLELKAFLMTSHESIFLNINFPSF